MKTIKYITHIKNVKELTDQEKDRLSKIEDKFAFRANDYYLGLINWEDPADPIRRIIIPTEDEFLEWGALDASGESKYIRVPGVEHKYQDTALFISQDTCGAFCRFCFRKRLFMHKKKEVTRRYGEGIEYIRNHPEIFNVLITGGDPLMMSTRKLEDLIRKVAEIPHVQIIRIGTKIPLFNPYRILEDPFLTEMIQRYSNGDKKIYIMLHINHPRELTRQSRQALKILKQAGAALVNQTPMIHGVNDNPQVLADLFLQLNMLDISPYYIFQCRPTLGNKTFAVPIAEGWNILEQAKDRVSGLGRRARLVMSHKTGKIEILAVTPDHTVMKYHRNADPANRSKVMIYKTNPDAFWLDDFEEYKALMKQEGLDEDTDLFTYW
ncbi:TPA: KamA family radical SAM protein [Candidatus Marinimicrobia bacterium]|nr:MAG: Uncharacterized protein XD77_0231 [Marinimicrobia bacterium 46_47]KUK91724.1 MAG: hypothetical protein XE04_0897 [Marinimicrobia bacterium 46_43]HAE87510.1 KamA family radical SAM protein [Candidatus Neomarinimicrobiota bacterium]HBY19259.1 KamA family radical SAM protein [Candidatus Neomarinimicrobiota bacterium]